MQRRVVEELVQDLIVLPIDIAPPDLAWRVIHLGRMPSHASARLPRGRLRAEVLQRIRAFHPAAIWLDGLWPGAFARLVSRHMKLPYFYRSHNIEHVYMARQAALAKSMSYRFRLRLALIGLQQFEERVIQGAAEVFDISMDDLAYWRTRGLANGHWLPPIVGGQVSPPDEAADSCKRFDMVFIGNLHTPNNVEGLRWLLLQVWPRVLRQRRGASALIAGSSPNDEVVRLVDRSEGVELQSNPDDVWPLYRSARVLVNPVRSGSGVNIKSVEMLQLDTPIISTPVGVGGLPPEIQRQFTVTDDDIEFANAIVRALDGSERLVDPVARAQARLAFTPSAITGVLDVIQRRLLAPPVDDQEA